MIKDNGKFVLKQCRDCIGKYIEGNNVKIVKEKQ